MTRSQLELLKKGTYFFLVLTLGGSVMWLSSGGTMFRSDLVNVNTSTDITPQSGLLTTLKNNTNTQVPPTQVVPTQLTPVSTQTGTVSSAVATNQNINAQPATNSAPAESTYDGFASLKSAAPYTQEESSSIVSENYTEEMSAEKESSKGQNEATDNSVTDYAPQVLTQTKATAPESGPAEVVLIVVALGLSFLFLSLKKYSH